ncbi:MAG: AAA family ATPase [Marvinbryantia sp.]|uniref:AAA family ATPase n=1 Tax=Marvinbryantia sp. TaxID=2496532 RepID=UPI0025D5AA09|nr:AAA family ATPase [uncultured Marvinbryantia sp.]
MSLKINQLEIENVKRIKAVKVEPAQDGLTIIGGNNRQGKTSVLDSITWALGGDRYRPSCAQREGSVIPPYIRITMNNGLVVERKGKNSDLKVTDPSGKKAGQQLLNEFIEQLALDLPKFMNSSGKEKAETLLRLIGIGDQVAALEKKEAELYSDRQAVGRIADQKKKYAREQVFYPDAPRELVSPTELIRRQQEILARNGENQRKRNALQQMQAQSEEMDSRIAGMEEQLRKMRAEREKIAADIETARKTAEELQDESTAELEADLANVEEINRKVRANLDKDKAEEDARDYERQYNQLTGQITKVREEKAALLDHAELPLPGLSVAEGELIYKGQKWDNMSGADQLKVSTAIVRKLNPECGFVLMDKLEQMDPVTLEEFGEWLTKEGLQVIATRVSTGDECSVIISDGYIEGQEHPVMEEKKTTWKAGEF